MTEFERLILKKQRRRQQAAQDSTHIKNDETPEASQPDMQTLFTQLKHRPETMSSSGMLRLQRTIGNAAIQRTIGGHRGGGTGAPTRPRKRAPATSKGKPPAPTKPPVISGVMTYAEFRSQLKKVNKKNQADELLNFSNVNQRLKRDRKYPLASQKDVGAKGDKDVVTAFQEFEQERNLSTLGRLYDAIKFWQALNLFNKGTTSKRIHKVLNILSAQIRAAIEKVTAEQADGIPQSAIDEMTGVTTGGVKTESIKMPQSLQAIGIPPAFFQKYLAGDLKLQANLELIYTLFDKGDLATASILFKTVGAQLPDHVNLLRSMYLSYFAGTVDAQKLGASKPGELSDDEKKAIYQYTAISDPINTALRKGDMGTHKTQYDNLISGLNKLPKMSGSITYRMETPFPGYEDLLQPGGVLADTAFRSAALSLQGAETALYKNASSKNVKGKVINLYFVIKTKNARRIGELAGYVNEAEALFLPTTRFKIDAIWQHVNGRVPKQASAQAKLIMHRVGEFKTQGDKTRDQYEADKANAGKDFMKEQLTPVKVIEMTEQ